MLNIGIAFDQNYFNQFGALSSSIFNSKRTEDNIHFHIITPDLTKNQKSELRKYVAKNECLIDFYTIDFELTKQFTTKDKWTAAVYYRLFFPILLKGKCNKILYLDSDTIVVNSLKDFFSISLENKPVACVYDNYVKIQPLIGIHEEGKYFNSGVLLIDINKWNEQKISEQAFKYLEKYPQNIKFVDQCALNAVLVDNWVSLDKKYNLLYSYIPWELPKKNQEEYLKNKIVIHYTLQRPWNMLCRNPLRYLYHKNLAQFPLKKDNKKYTDFKINNLIPFFKIKVFEFYSNSRVLKYFNSIFK